MENKRLKIGLQIGCIDSGYKMELFKRMDHICKKRNHDFFLIPGEAESSSQFTYQQDSVFRHITKKNFNAVIIQDGQFEEMKSKLMKSFPIPEDQAVPLVSLIERVDGLPSIYADLDEYKKLINHMIDAHHCSSFNIIAGPKKSHACLDRLSTVLNALDVRGFTVEDKRIFYGDFSQSTGYGAMVYFQSEGVLDCDCIISLNDDMAIGAVQFCKKRNINIPEDVKIIGFEDTLQGQYEDVSLTTVGADMDVLCNKAVDFAESAASGMNLPLIHSVKSNVKLRKSCGCIPADDYVVDYIDLEGNENLLTPEGLHVISQRFMNLEQDMLLLRQFFSNINEMQTITSAVSNLRNSLNILKVRSCAVVLYEKRIVVNKDSPFELPDKADLILRYEETDFKANVGSDVETIHFNPRENIIPPHTFSDRRRTLIIKSLYYLDGLYGYVLYEPGRLSPVLYDTAFNLIASSLNSAVIFTTKSANEKHQSQMLKQLESTNTELNAESLTDELTKLYNRRGILTFGQETINLAFEMERKGIVIYADMDGLKAINDTFGHEAGDTAIKGMADILKKTFRNNDIIGRMGGDEFVIIATGIDQSFMGELRNRLKSAEEKWNEFNKQPFKLSISLGAVDFTEAENLDLLLQKADGLLYKEKCAKHARSSRKESIS